MQPSISRLLKLMILMCVALLETACTHWVVVRTTPPGARARVDGVDMGTTPFFLEETTGWNKVYRLELEKEGYEPTKIAINQDDLQLRYACPAVCLVPFTFGLSLIGCAWSYGLADEYHFVLVPLDDSRRNDGAPGSPSSPDVNNPPGDVPRREEEKPAVPF